MFPVYNFYNRYLQGQTDNSQYDFSQWDGSQFCCGDGFWTAAADVMMRHR
jgi:hypothetical protein